MNLTPLTAGKVSGTGTVKMIGRTGNGGTLGGVLITTDSSTAGVVILRKDNATGDIIFDISTVPPIFVTAPIRVNDTDTIYFDISGANASAMLYEWND